MAENYERMLTEAQKLGEEYKPKEKKYKQLTAKIKDFLLSNPNETITNGKHFAELRTSYKNEVDEVGLIEFLKENKTEEFIETKEVLDMGKLESAIFNKTLPKSVLDSIGKFFTVKETKSIYISRIKQKEGK